MLIYYNIKGAESFNDDFEYANEHDDSAIFDLVDVNVDVDCYLSDYLKNQRDVVEWVDNKYPIQEELLSQGDCTIILYHKRKNNLEKWNDILGSLPNYNSISNSDYLYEMMKVANETGLVEYKGIITKIISALNKYRCSLNKNVFVSNDTIFQLVRYVPFFSEKESVDFYLDQDTGYIGVIMSMKKHKKGTLNLTVMNTSEVYYSYVRKKTGLVKFSGKGYLGNDLDNSDAIMAILKMSDW